MTLTPPLGIDFSAARPDPAAVARAEYVVVFRYLPNGSSRPDLTAAEAAGYLAAGLGVAVVWESAGDRAVAGATAGAGDGAIAVRAARNVGYPAGCVIFANVGDFAATPAQLPAIKGYYGEFARAVTAAGYVCGGYGTGWIIDQLAPVCKGVWWQNAMDDNGERGAIVSPNSSAYQRVAPTKSIYGQPPGSYDENVIIRPFPWWTAQTVVEAPQAAPVTPAPVVPVPVPPAVQQKVDNMIIGTDHSGNLIVAGNAADNGNLLVFTQGPNGWSVVDVTEEVHNENPADARQYKIA